MPYPHMARDRIQLDFVVSPTFGNDEKHQPYSWDQSPASSATSGGPARVIELGTERGSSESPEAPEFEMHKKQRLQQSNGRKGSTGGGKGESSSGSTMGSGIRKGRGKQAFRHRKSHIKSKNGCFSCKERRVKVRNKGFIEHCASPHTSTWHLCSTMA